MPAKNNEVEAVLRGATTRRGWMWPTVIGIAIVLAVGAVWLWMGGTGSQTVTQYVSETVDRGDIVEIVTATGSVEPTNQVEISSELSGTIRSVEFDFNDEVKAGDILARLDTDSLEANLSRARANLAAAEARIAETKVTLDETEAAYERAVQLAEKGLTSTQSLMASKASYDRATAAMQSAEANRDLAQADLEINEASLAKACICSPIDGVVLQRNVEVGQIVAASFSAPVLFTLAEDLTKMQLQVDVDEADIGRVTEGDEAIFTVEAYQDTTFPARIEELRFAPLTVSGVVTYKAVLAIDNTDLLLRPGMTATADIIIARSLDVLRVPNAALRFTFPNTSQETSEDSGGLFGGMAPSPAPSTNSNEASATGTGSVRTIWVLRDNVPEAVSITTGATDGTFTEVTSGGLESGDRVIVDIGAS